ncbi:MAG TPA: PadR family transcriptional regulator [Acidimicrobiales bacterium]|nr:PadR family transcriptional regulator [Acidimicrobiales bacterium]
MRIHDDHFRTGPPWAGRIHDHAHGHGHEHGRAGGRRGWGDLGPPWAGGRRMRRGDVRLALLDALLDGPAHGYELISRLEQRSGGMWRPSAGSVYPTLQLLEEQGSVTGRDEEGKRIYQLTDEGRIEAGEARDLQPWSEGGPSEAHRQLRFTLGQLAMAARQVAQVGDDTNLEAANRILVEARQKLYLLLAGD